MPIKHNGPALVIANPLNFQPLDELHLIFGKKNYLFMLQLKIYS